jgi:hypothetical protein
VCAAVTQSDVWDFSPIHRAFDMDNEGLVSELEYYIFMLQVFLLYSTRCVRKHCIRPVVSGSTAFDPLCQEALHSTRCVMKHCIRPVVS